MKRKRKRCRRSHYRTKPTKGRGIRMCSCGRGWIRVAVRDKKRKVYDRLAGETQKQAKKRWASGGRMKNPSKVWRRYKCSACKRIVTNQMMPPTHVAVRRHGRAARHFKFCPGCFPVLLNRAPKTHPLDPPKQPGVTFIIP